MAFQLVGPPNLNVQPPNIDPLGQAAKMASLKQMLGQNALIPLQQQEAQQKVQSNDLAIQQQQNKLNSQQALIKAWSDPDFASTVTGGTGKDVAGAVGFEPGFDPNSMVKALVKRGVLPEDAMGQAASFLELSKNLSAKTKDDLANYKDSHQQLANLLAPITDMKATDAGPALDVVKQKVASGSIPGLDPRDVQLLQQADLQHLQPVINLLNVGSQIADYHKQSAEEAKAATDAIKSANEVAPVTPNNLSTFQNVIVPGYKALDPEQQRALVAEAAQARTVGELQDVMKRADEMDKSQQMHKDSLAQTAALAGDRFKQKGAEANESTWTKYGEVSSQLTTIKNALQAGADGNGLAASMAPTMTALGINGFNNMHRISPAEAQSAQMPGGYAERFNAWADKAFTGKLNAQVAKEGQQLMDQLLSASYDRAYQASQLHTKTFGLDPKTTPAIAKDSGEITTLDKVKPSKSTPAAAPQHVAGGQAQGLTEGQTGKGSDGKPYIVKGGVWVPAQ
jgi:hypothetical protein